jgi:adenosylcobinamide kinase / adenosylcobinamide-phosphate guanylyltransferase
VLTLILGGAKSGKSRLAQRMAMPAARVTYIATWKRVDDAEMLARIERHRESRPASWTTIEEPLALADAVERAAADVVIVDCLTIWLSNLCFERIDDGTREQLDRIATAAKSHHVILVSNDVGGGTIPEHPVARAFRDSQGMLNQWAAEVADEVILTVAGLPMHLKGGPSK